MNVTVSANHIIRTGMQGVRRVVFQGRRREYSLIRNKGAIRAGAERLNWEKDWREG